FAARKQVRRNVNTTWRSLQPLRHGFADLARDVGKPQILRGALKMPPASYRVSMWTLRMPSAHR
ncbi:hypothetical protein, partial [Paraburkholderia aspalathi]|uniref:hypothetical protein n=1 Tax=Paraburkholderia aspalathi TaxID=1324617 RepID=UPI001BAD8836